MSYNGTLKREEKITALVRQLREVKSEINTPEFIRLRNKLVSKYDELTKEEQARYDVLWKEKKPLFSTAKRLKRRIKKEREIARALARPAPLFRVLPKDHIN